MDEDLRVLTDKQIQDELLSHPGWTYHDHKITKEFKFKSFLEGLDLVNRLAHFCNRIDHHPDIHIYYKKIVFDLQRFSVGGRVTARDFTVASEIDLMYNSLTSD